MAWRFVLQPNGKLGVFSDTTDDFRHNDLSECEALMLAESYGLNEKEAKEKVQGGVEDWEPRKRFVKGDGLSRWRACMATIRRVHGDELATIIEGAYSANSLTVVQ